MEIHAEFTGSQCLAHAKRHVQKMNRALAELVETDYKQKNNRFERLRTDYSKFSGSKFQLSRGDHVLVKIMQPKGMCGKFYIQWRGVYCVAKQIDKNVFEVYLKGNERRRFVNSWKGGGGR